MSILKGSQRDNSEADPKREAVLATLRRINRAWLDRQVEDLGSMLHPEVVMVFPGFAGRIRGRQQLVDSFRDFCDSAKIHEFRDHDYQGDVAGNTAVASFEYEMVYERSGELYRSTGQDLWIFQSQGDTWIAVWRTMLDIREEPA